MASTQTNDGSYPNSRDSSRMPPSAASRPAIDRQPEDSMQRGSGGGYGYGGTPGYGAYAGSEANGASSGFQDILREVRLILAKWWLVALAMILGFSLSAWRVFYDEPTYRATALLEMSVRRPRILNQPGAMIDEGVGWREEEIINTRIAKMRGQATRAIAREMLETRQRGLTGNQREALHAALGRVDLSWQQDTYLLHVSAQGPDPEMTALAATTYARAAIEMTRRQNTDESEYAVAWLLDQADQLRAQLDRAEEDLIEFRTQENIDLIEVRKRMVEDSLVSLSRELTEIENGILLTQDLVELLRLLQVQPEQSGRLPDSTPRREEILASLTRWQEALLQRQTLMSRYTERHPEVVEADRRIDEYRQQAVQAIERARENASANLVLYRQQANSLRRRIDEQSQEARSLDGQLAQLKMRVGALERHRDAADFSYKSLLNRIEEARLSADETTTLVRMLDEAGTPTRPVGANALRTLFLGIVLGGVGGVGLALGLARLEDHISDRAMLERRTGSRVLGLIPRVPHAERRDLARLGLSREYHGGVEAFANLRAMLDSETFSDMTSSILVSSVLPGEGKTIVAANLALIYARAGYRTLLVDFDLRRPRVRRIFNVPREVTDLTEAMAQSVQRPSIGVAPGQDEARRPDAPGMDDAVWQVEETGLWVAGNRQGISQPACDVLGQPAVQSMIDWATGAYDRVIFDSAPYSLIGDALVLAGRVAGVVFVCRPSITRVGLLSNAIREYGEAGAGIIGLVINDVKFGFGAYFRGYDYASGHAAYRYTARYGADYHRAADR